VKIFGKKMRRERARVINVTYRH